MNEKQVLQLNLDDILPNRFQPRIRFNEQAINELAESIKKHGVIQPIVVRAIGDKYEIIAGERRFKASALIGNKTIPAIVADLDDRNSAEVALIENVQRQDLTPIEEATSYKKILDMGYLTQQELATKLGKEQSTVANKLRLLNLHEDVQEALLDEEISERHARSLLRLDKEAQKLLLVKILAERLTVRKTDQEIDNILSNKTEKTPEVIDFILGNEEQAMPEVLDFSETVIVSPSEVETKQSETLKEINTPVVNFVDIEKIENEAKDIFVEKPAVDINDLFNKTEEPIDLTPRKFFTFAPKDEVVEDEKVEEEVFNKFEFNSVEPVAEKTVEVEENNDSFDNMFNVSFDKPIETPKAEENVVEEPFDFNFDKPIEVVAAPSVEETQIVETPLITAFNQEPLKFNFNVEAINEPIIEKPMTEPIYDDLSDDIPVIEAPSDVVVASDMKAVINAVRNCTATIEKFGYVVDTDEFDFDDIYQVIIKINKK